MNRFIYGVLLLLLSVGCQNQETQSKEAQLTPFEDFLKFYDRFHQDSLYQMAHIRFPLEGLPSNADSATLAGGQFRWNRTDWELMREFDPESEFERSFTPLTETLIVEQMTHSTGRYGLQRRWAKQGEDWYLIYYAGLNVLPAN